MMKKIVGVILLICSIFSNILDAKEISLDEKIAGLYISFFDRAPDEEGLLYWLNRGKEANNLGKDVSDVLKELSAGFATHPSFDRAYGSLDNKSFVEEIYRNTLGRDGDEPGINFWSGLLNNGMSRSDFVSIFVEAALTFDRNDPQYIGLSKEDLDQAQLRQDLLANKVEVALRFTTELGSLTNVVDNQNPEDDPAYKASIKIISETTEQYDTVKDTIYFIDKLIVEDKNSVIFVINNTKHPYFSGTAYYYLIKGVSYDCGTQKGITDENGKFTFDVDSKCSFYIGDMQLKSFDTSLFTNGKVYKEFDFNISRILQSLDIDNEPKNGIIINESVAKVLDDNNISQLPQTQEEIEQVCNLIVSEGGNSVSKQDAEESVLFSVLPNTTVYTSVSLEEGTLKEIHFNEDLSEVSWKEIIGENSGDIGVSSSHIEGNKIYIEDNISRVIIRVDNINDEYMSAYLHEVRYGEFDNKIYEGNIKLYFDKNKAEESLIDKQLRDLFRGKVFYTSIDQQEGTIETWSFNTDFSFVQWQGLVGGCMMGENHIRKVYNNQIVFYNEDEKTYNTLSIVNKTDDYIDVLLDNREKMRLYFDKSKAEELLIDKQFKDLLAGKRFYTSMEGRDETLETWFFDENFSVFKWQELVGGNDSGEHCILSIYNNMFIIHLEEEDIDVKVSLISQNDDYISLMVNMGQSNEEVYLYFDRDTAEKYLFN